MHKTIFDSPILAPALRWLSRKIFQLKGWDIDFSAKQGVEKCVIIGAPHTSNWDLPYALMLAFSQELPIYWMGKIQIFKPPFRGLMMWLGGIPIDRSGAHNAVSQAAAQFQQSERLYMVIAPEGTRAAVSEWKTGFYHIAHQSGVPVLPVFFDRRQRKAGIYCCYHTSGDPAKDIAEIRSMYGDLLQRHKHNQLGEKD